MLCAGASAGAEQGDRRRAAVRTFLEGGCRVSKHRWTIFVGAVVALGVLVAGPAGAAPRTKIGVSFFKGGNGSAHWSKTHSTGPDAFSMRLDVPDGSSYAGISLHHVSDTLPDSEPGFVFYETGTVSGGSPRLVIASTDACYAVEYAYPETADTWNPASQWDLMGTCGFVYNATWAGVRSAFASRTVAAVYMVDDTFQPSGHTSWIDELQYDGQTISEPSDNHNG
jgi:hypothetical protein